ncbi:di-trans,poly-cis-decaprenylcistransferase [Arcobacter roscoffensis]|uniref:Isoprenyl transferase n=1 Tax=Arcobacter roscoffensis TaxID=2961520 RepID=A0ABY5E6F8_9BACT|nr:di-trans,poly-cis-decaprenylcistransferase [Arcobacter roscoffensis]UTJ06350.1 di-trans,poly-cis-decaprenylcistransferase [Arcobacter roscoffensis]|tara:strand:+ start:1497 stop:2186 length:690 start_codon:yes stop_codon:yes gene_type:complete
MNNEQKIPTHIAMIMDGNGRWAKERGLKRTVGHEEGAKVVRNITKYCMSIGVKYLTLYAFSTENWKRPKLEVEFLMKLLDKYLKNELEVYLKNNVRFKAIGDLSKFSKKLQETIRQTEEKTSKCDGLTQVLALNYGSKDEIVRAVKRLNEKGLEVSEENLESCLDTAGIPDVDVMIRTSGEVRLSNYLLWQNAYAEMFFTQTYWPDFNNHELDDIISDFNSRERRFGAV